MLLNSISLAKVNPFNLYKTNPSKVISFASNSDRCDFNQIRIENAEFAEENNQSAAFGGMIGYKKYLAGNLENADTILPIYLRKSQAERLKK